MNYVRLLRSFPQRPVTFFKISSVKYVTHPAKFLEAEDRWRERDNVSKRWHLIYKAPMDKWLNYLSFYLTFSTATLACSGVYYAAFIFSEDTMNTPVMLGDVVVANSAVECLVYIGAFVIFHIAVKVVLSKYVLRLYQDGDRYLAIFRGHMYNSIKKHEFHLKEFKKLNPTIVVSWSEARFALGNKHAIILENYFKTPEHFNYLLYKKHEDNEE